MTTEWRLPEQLKDLTDPARANTIRVRNVVLADSLARHPARGWDNAALPDDYRKIAVLLRMEPDKVMALVKGDPRVGQD